MKKFVISLLSADKRRTHIVSEFKKHNLEFDFFNALFPSENLNQQIDTFLPNLHHSHLTDGEKACFMSHYMLLRQGISQNLAYFTIFEDDILLGEHSEVFLSDDNWIQQLNLPDDCIIKLESYPKKIIVASPHIKVMSRAIFKLKYSYLGAASYVVSKAAAEKVVDIISCLPADKLKAIDELLFDDFIENNILPIYQLDPALTIQERFYKAELSELDSYLEDDRKIRLEAEKLRKKKKNILASIVKEIHRFFWRSKRKQILFK